MLAQLLYCTPEIIAWGVLATSLISSFELSLPCKGKVLYLKVIYHFLYGINNYVLIWGDWLSCDPLSAPSCGNFDYLSQIYSYYIRGDRSPLICIIPQLKVTSMYCHNESTHFDYYRFMEVIMNMQM